MNKAMAIEQPPDINGMADAIREYWGYLIGFVGALATIVGVFRKHVWKILVGAKNWIIAAVELPATLSEIRSELQFENGLSLRQIIHGWHEDMAGIRRLIAFETAARRSMWQSLNTPIFETAADGRFLWVTDAFLSLTKMSMPQVLGNNWRNAVVTPDREQAVDTFSMAVRDATDCKMKFRLTTGDDSEVWVVFDAICNKDDIGNVLGFVGKLRETRDPRIHSTEN